MEQVAPTLTERCQGCAHVEPVIVVSGYVNATVDDSASVYGGQKPLDMARTNEVKVILQKAGAK